MDPKVVEEARLTLAAERDRLRLVLSEEVEHPKVAHGAQTAAATEVTESQRGQQMRERDELHLSQIEGALKRIDAGSFGTASTATPRSAAEGRRGSCRRARARGPDTERNPTTRPGSICRHWLRGGGFVPRPSRETHAVRDSRLPSDLVGAGWDGWFLPDVTWRVTGTSASCQRPNVRPRRLTGRAGSAGKAGLPPRCQPCPGCPVTQRSWSRRGPPPPAPSPARSRSHRARDVRT